MTSVIRGYFCENNIARLCDLYDVTEAKTAKEKHVCRGCLSTMQANGEVISLGNRLWQKLY